MPRLQAMLLSRTAKATSAACVICGCAWLYAKHRLRNDSDKASIPFAALASWLPSSRWLWKARESDATLIDHLDSALRTLTINAREKELQTDPQVLTQGSVSRAVAKQIHQALQRFVLLSKDPLVCDNLLANPAIGALMQLTAERGEHFEHSVLRLLAELFANLSPRDAAKSVFLRNGMEPCIRAWIQRKDCAHLSVCASKMNENLLKGSESLFGPHVYPLTSLSGPPLPSNVDVVFVNGINGSVFHTWRQHDDVAELDAKYTKCWPRDWLSEDFPQARVLGVDVKVRAWSWDPTTSNRPDERTLACRSAHLRADLERAEVGRDGRAIVWVTHSMGGLLVKEVLRQAEEERSQLCSSTRGVLFMSTPHLGTTSLKALFYFPFRLALSLETKELQMNSGPLRQLDTWFRGFVERAGVRVINLVETLPTQVNPVYSVILVTPPEDDPSQRVTIPSDHINISKPRDRNDVIYTTIKTFLGDCIS